MLKATKFYFKQFGWEYFRSEYTLLCLPKGRIVLVLSRVRLFETL